MLTSSIFYRLLYLLLQTSNQQPASTLFIEALAKMKYPGILVFLNTLKVNII